LEGSILLHRQLLESSVFASEKRLKIWVWLLLRASYKERHIPIKVGNGESIITIQRGQLLFGRFKAEESLCIDGSTIYKILQWMEKEDMIKIESNSHYSILTINNFNTYQTFENDKVTTVEQPSNNQVTTEEQPSNNQVTHTIKNKQDKQDKQYIPESFLLNDFSKLYFEEKYINDDSLKTFDELIRIDKYNSEQIKESIQKARSQQFWDSNFLSPVKLRKKDKDGVKYIDKFLAIKVIVKKDFSKLNTTYDGQ
jgi:hypothetical protein